MTSWFCFMKDWFRPSNPFMDAMEDNEERLLYETTFSRIYQDRDDERVVLKHIFKPSLYYHEKQLCVGLADQSDYLVSLLGSDDNIQTLFFPKAQHDLMTWYLRYDDEKETLSKQFLSRYFPPLVQGLEDLYRNGVEHYDIKPENVLIFEDGRVQLTDFGLAQRDASCYFPSSGTFPYMAPELTLPFTEYYVRHSMDVYSVCALAVYFIFPRLFVPRDRCMTKKEYLQLEEDALFLFLKNRRFSPSFFSLLIYGLKFDPVERISLPLFVSRMKRCFVEEKKIFFSCLP